jgi:hypothetical protein
VRVWRGGSAGCHRLRSAVPVWVLPVFRVFGHTLSCIREVFRVAWELDGREHTSAGRSMIGRGVPAHDGGSEAPIDVCSATDLTRADLAAMTPEQITQARQAGKLAKGLGADE